MAKKRRLSKADKLKRENIKWVFMFVLLVLTIAVYLASFIEADKTQSSIDFNKKTLVKLTEYLKVKKKLSRENEKSRCHFKKGEGDWLSFK